MRGSHQARTLTAALLVASALLAVLAAAERWVGICARTTWRSDACWERRDRLYDQLLPTDPWVPIGHAAQLHGFSSLLLAAAVALMPAALGRRSTWWQALSVSVSALVLAAAGAIALLAGLTGQVVDPPGMAVLGELWFWWLPFLVPIGLFPLDADRRPVGPVGGLAVWLLAFAMPWPQLFFFGFTDETVPWSDATIAVPLLVAALLLRPWSRQRSFSNQQRAHSLSL